MVDVCENWFDCTDTKKPLSMEQVFRMLITKDANDCPAIRTRDTSASGGGSSVDYELSYTSYNANTTNGSNYTAGDRIKRVDIINVANGLIVNTVWLNETTGTAITAPIQLHLDPITVNQRSLVKGFAKNIIDTTATEIIAAPGAGLYNHITQILVTNSHATVGTLVDIIDETTGDVLYTGYAAPAGGGFSCSFPSDAALKQNTSNKKLQAKCITTGASVTVSASGYKAS